MADKKITDLQLIDEVTDDVNLPGDDTIQTYRVTALQLWEYIRGKMFASRVVSAGGDVIDSGDALLYCDPTSSSFTYDLPDCATLPMDFPLTFKNIATNGNTVTLDPHSTQKIDEDSTVVLASDPIQDALTIVNKITGWKRI